MDHYLEKINKLIPIQKSVAGLNPALYRLYPVAIAEGDQMLIHDYEAALGQYTFITKLPSPMPIPKGLRAAFQLEGFGGRIACVVTPEIFNSLEGYVTILHEFVHCYQYETCEQDLKLKLDVARQAQEIGDVMWEIEHPFPYQAEAFIRAYGGFIDALGQANQANILQSRKALRSYLGLHDFEYMIWQEWKEGFARWVENCLQRELGLPINQGGSKPPFSRVSFYAGGAAYIDFLSIKNPGVVHDLEHLFDLIGSLNHDGH
jgi:hypothetical protein